MISRKQIAIKLSYLMPHIARALTASFIQTTDLPPAQIFALLTLQERGICHFAVLCQDLHIAAPTATGIIDRLEKAGYVQRQPDPQDRRAINLVLTTQGEKIAQEIRSGVTQRWEILLEKLPLEDGEHYLRIVDKIYNQMVNVKSEHNREESP